MSPRSAWSTPPLLVMEQEVKLRFHSPERALARSDSQLFEIQRAMEVKPAVGTMFGKLTVIGDARPTAIGVRRVLCWCACGKRIKVSILALVDGRVKSCGCRYRRDEPGGDDLTGHTFSQLTVTGPADTAKDTKDDGVKRWACVCTCGAEVKVRDLSLRMGTVKHCKLRSHVIGKAARRGE